MNTGSEMPRVVKESLPVRENCCFGRGCDFAIQVVVGHDLYEPCAAARKDDCERQNFMGAVWGLPAAGARGWWLRRTPSRCPQVPLRPIRLNLIASGLRLACNSAGPAHREPSCGGLPE